MPVDTKRYVSKPKARALLMMRTPDAWPRWPALPLKRYNPERGLDVGILWDGQGPRVFRCTVHNMPKDLKALPQDAYPDYETLYADGWRVD